MLIYGTKQRTKTCKRNRKKGDKKKCKSGAGIIDRLIDKIPFELHLPNYQYCGPGTKLKKRMERGDLGINPLDAACKEHDIAYNQHEDSKDRAVADKVLQNVAMKRVISADASMGERAAALGVAAAMKAKRTLTGQGIGRKQIKIGGKCLNKKKTAYVTKKKKKNNEITFSTLIKNDKVAIKRAKPETVDSAIKIAVRSIKKAKEGSEIKSPRTIKMPSISGGVLPLIPIFAGLGALGSIVGSTAGVANAINQAKKAQEELAESQRHNTMMEAIAIGKKKGGKGFYLRPNKNGNGFYLSPYTKNR